MLTINDVISKIKKNSPDCDCQKLLTAFEFAEKSHLGQKRHSGEPYIQHPLSVMNYLADFRLDVNTYTAAILHDILEDTKVDQKTLKEKFGNEVLRLIEGMTKLEKIKFKNNLDLYQTENFRKMVLASAEDLRVILIKLYDRLHNLTTLNAMPLADRKRVARETMEIYAPLAYRLGIGELKGQLEDLAFQYLYPHEYNFVKKVARDEINKRRESVERVKKELEKLLKSAKISYLNIHGRAKHLYSLFKKLQRHDNNINDVYDLFALRVIVHDVADCYGVLGKVHQHWKPLLGRIKDYIAVPKTGGYQSLHTTVITSDEKIIEIQIRTEKMHQEAEYGLAASWYYQESEKVKTGKKVPKGMRWMSQLSDWQKEITDTKKFSDLLKVDILTENIFVFTPNGDVIDLPDGSTPLDFAYKVHTEIGNHYSCAIVNGKMVSIDYQLKNGDIINIITKKTITPSLNWLEIAHSQQAQGRIKNYLRKIDFQKNVDHGKSLLDQELFRIKQTTTKKLEKTRIQKLLAHFSYKNFEQLLAAIGYGDLSVKQIVEKVYPNEEILEPRMRQFFFFGKPVNEPRAMIEKNRGLLTIFAKCCHPIVGDSIKAFITRGTGATIHKTNCKELKKLKKQDKGRIYDAFWEKSEQLYCRADVVLEVLDRVGLLKDITEKIAALEVNIASLKTSTAKSGINNIILTVEIKNVAHLAKLLDELEKIDGVLRARKD